MTTFPLYAIFKVEVMRMRVQSEAIGIQERFLPVDIKFLDSKNRINLGDKIRKVLFDKMKVEAFKIYLGEEGDILLRAVVNVPSREAWLYKNSAALKHVREGLEEAKQGKVEKISDLEDFLTKL